MVLNRLNPSAKLHILTACAWDRMGKPKKRSKFGSTSIKLKKCFTEVLEMPFMLHASASFLNLLLKETHLIPRTCDLLLLVNLRYYIYKISHVLISGITAKLSLF